MLINFPNNIKNQRNVCVCMDMHELIQLVLKGAVDNILKFSFWLNFILHVKIDC